MEDLAASRSTELYSDVPYEIYCPRHDCVTSITNILWLRVFLCSRVFVDHFLVLHYK